MSHRAIFLDRDGTLVHPRHYPSRPTDLSLYSGIEAPLRRLQAAGFRLVLVTNQAGIARGYFTEDDLGMMHEYLSSELQRLGVHLDGIYYCPHHPEGVVSDLAVVCQCRKPRPGMLLQAAADLDIDLHRSWFVGDILDDMEAGQRAGCHTVLVDLGTEPCPTHPLRQPDFIARNTYHALSLIVAWYGLGPATEMRYCPSRWTHQGVAV